MKTRPAIAPFALALLLGLGGTGLDRVWARDGARQTDAGQEVLTLQQAIALALADNDSLGAAEAASSASAASAEEARAARLPTIQIDETFQGTTNPVYVFGNLLSQEAFGPENFAVDSLNNPDPLSNFNTRLTGQMPVWTGGRIERRIEAARFGAEAAEARRERTRQEVVRQVIDAYTGAVLARSHLAVASESLETARAHVGLVGNLREGGLVVESDLLQARVREAEVQEMVIRAESAVAIADAALNLAMGRDLDSPVTLPETLAAEVLPEEDLAELIAAAHQGRPDLRATDRELQAADRLAAATRADFLPEIGLVGTYEANAEKFIGADGSNWSLMAAARFTIFDGGARGARVRQAEAKRLQAEHLRDLLADSISLEIRQAFFELRASAERLELARRSVQLAEESLRIVENRYRNGLTTLVELLDAETALTRARFREVKARLDLLTGRARLDLAVGRL